MVGLKWVVALLLVGVGGQVLAAGNLLTDAGFEEMPVSEITGSTAPWWSYHGGGEGSGGGAWIVSEKSRSAAQAAKLFLFDEDWSWCVLGQAIDRGVNPGLKYRASIDVMRVDVIYPAVVELKVEWLSRSGDTLSVDVAPEKLNDESSEGDWHTLSHEFKSPRNAHGAKLEIVFSKPSGDDPSDIYADNARFELVE